MQTPILSRLYSSRVLFRRLVGISAAAGWALVSLSGWSAPIIIGYNEIVAVGNYSQATMDRVGQTRWFFAHASVGGGFCEGVWRDNFYNPTFYELTRFPCASNPPSTVTPGAVCEIGRGNPGWQLKIDWFSNYLAGGWCYPTVDYSMNKLGSVDPGADWWAYVSSYVDLEAMYPSTTLIYMTMPLTTNEDSDNVLRNQFNNNLRAWVQANGRILLDDADMEAHDTNGVAYTFTTNGVVYQKLWDGYSSDGSHPNSVGGQNWLGLMFYATANAILTQRGPYVQGRAVTVPATQVQIQWASSSNEVYSVLRTTNLVAGPWEVVASGIAATPPWNSYTEIADPVEAYFYQIAVRSASGATVDSKTVIGAPSYGPGVMDSIGQLRWFFAHSLVGASLIDGLGRLHTMNPNLYALIPFTCFSNPPAMVEPGQVGDFFRGDPGWQAKLDWFSNDLTAGWVNPKVDVVMNDLDVSDAAANWLAYALSVQALEAQYPMTTFVYMTMPLTTNEDRVNIQRNLFNQNLRAWVRWNGKLLYDVADLESHDTNGLAYTFTSNGSTYQKLYPGFTSDGQQPAMPDFSAQIWLAKGFYGVAAAIPADRQPAMQIRTQPGTATALQMQWTCHSNEMFSVQGTLDPFTGGWVTLASNIVATPPWTSYTGRMGQAAGYFRVLRTSN